MARNATRCATWCNGKLGSVPGAQGLSRCDTCKRFWIGGIVLIAWKDFAPGGKEDTSCPRCGDTSDFNFRTLRYKCSNLLCQYGWREKGNRESLREKGIKAEQQELIPEIARQGLASTAAATYSKLKEELAGLHQDEF